MIALLLFIYDLKLVFMTGNDSVHYRPLSWSLPSTKDMLGKSPVLQRPEISSWGWVHPQNFSCSHKSVPACLNGTLIAADPSMLPLNLHIFRDKRMWKWGRSLPCRNPVLNAWNAVTYQRGSYGGGRQSVRYDDEKDGVAQQQSDLEGHSLSAVRWQIETNNVHHHQEDAGQQQVHSVEQWPPSDHHLEKLA